MIVAAVSAWAGMGAVALITIAHNYGKITAGDLVACVAAGPFILLYELIMLDDVVWRRRK